MITVMSPWATSDHINKVLEPDMLKSVRAT